MSTRVKLWALQKLQPIFSKKESLELPQDKLLEEENTPDYNAMFYYDARLMRLWKSVWLARDKKKQGLSIHTNEYCITMRSLTNRSRLLWNKHQYVTLKIGNTGFLNNNLFAHEERVLCSLTITDVDHQGYPYMTKLLDNFKIKGAFGEHACLVLEAMRESLWQYQGHWPEHKLPLSVCKTFLQKILQGLDYIHTQCHLIQGDIKPDNILVGIEKESIFLRFIEKGLKSPSPKKETEFRTVYRSNNNFGPVLGMSERLQIADFGISSWGDKVHPQHRLRQAVRFKAPENILGAPWSYSIDIWNLGVMLWNVLENRYLFSARNPISSRYSQLSHVGEMVALLRPPPRALLERSEDARKYFDRNGRFVAPNRVPDHLTLEGSLLSLSEEERREFLRFARRTSCWIPEERATAAELLEDPFLREHK